MNNSITNDGSGMAADEVSDHEARLMIKILIKMKHGKPIEVSIAHSSQSVP